VGLHEDAVDLLEVDGACAVADGFDVSDTNRGAAVFVRAALLEDFV
jgi:hypothetical protein